MGIRRVLLWHFQSSRANINFKPSKELISRACRLLLSKNLLFLLCRSPPHPPPALRLCEEISAWLVALAQHSGLSPLPPPSASARHLQKRWLDSREAVILQLRQSRLHRWVAIQARCRPPLLFYCSGPGKLFFTLFYLCWFCAWGFSPPRRALICPNTKQRCEAALREPWGGFLRADGTCFCRTRWPVWFWFQVWFTGLCQTLQQDLAEWIKTGALHERLV